MIEKIDGCKNNPEKSSTKKFIEYIPPGFSMSTISSFKDIQSRHDVYRGKDYTNNFCESLREHAIKINDFKKKRIKSFTNEQEKSYGNGKMGYICNKKFEDEYIKDKNRDHCHFICEYRGTAHICICICDLKCTTPKEITVIFHNGSNYD